MGYDNDQDDIVLGELDTVEGPTDEETEAAATEEIDESQISPEDGMRRRSAARREERARRKARRKELNQSSPDTGKGRKIAAAGIALVLCASLIAGGVYYFYFRGRNAGNNMAGGNNPLAGMDFGNINLITATGTTSIGMSLETFDLNLSDVDLTIDEVYVSNRDEVEENQPILKIDEDSIKNARIKLEQSAKSAEYAYQLNEVDAQEDVITAKNTYEQALIALQYAEQDYADTVSEAQAEIDSLERQIEDQQEKVDEYQAAVNDPDYYSKEYNVPEIKEQLEKDQALLQSIYDDDSTRVAEHLDFVYGGSYEAWLNDEEFENLSGNGGGMPSGGAPSMPDNTSGSGSENTGTADTTTAGNSDSSTGSSSTDETESTNNTSGTAADAAASASGTEDTSAAAASVDSTVDAATDGIGSTSGAGETSESVSTTVTQAPHEVIVYDLSADGEETFSETITNKTYYAEAPSGASGSMPAAASGSSGSVSGSSSGSSSSSSSGSATITDEYVGDSSVNTEKALSTSSLSNDDLVYFPWYAAYVALSEEITEEMQEYEDAVADAKRDQARASSLLSQANNKLDSLQLKLRTAKNDLITTTEEAQETLDTVRAEAAAAQETYNTSIRSIENTADTLKDTMEQADEDLASFEEQIGDGFLYTSNAGTIMMVGVEEGDTLTYNAMIAAYTDPGSISVSAAVDQSNIASISVGDTTAVVFEDAGIYQGYVAAINPVTQSSSRTSVTYNVTVELQGDVSEVEENISATVYFGDAVPLVFQQAGDQLHSPDAAETADDAGDTLDDAGTVADTANDAVVSSDMTGVTEDTAAVTDTAVSEGQ